MVRQFAAPADLPRIPPGKEYPMQTLMTREKKLFVDPAPDGIFDAINEPHRRQIIRLLGHEDRNVTDLTRTIGIRQQMVSHHLTPLKLRGLVTCDRQGKSNFYRLTELGRK